MQAPQSRRCYHVSPARGGGGGGGGRGRGRGKTACITNTPREGDSCSDSWLDCSTLYDSYKSDCAESKCDASYSIDQNRIIRIQADGCARDRERYTTQCVHPACRDKGHRVASTIARRNVRNCDSILYEQSKGSVQPLTVEEFFDTYCTDTPTLVYSPLFVLGETLLYAKRDTGSSKYTPDGRLYVGVVTVWTGQSYIILSVYSFNNMVVLHSRNGYWMPVWSGVEPDDTTVQEWIDAVNS